MKLFQIEEPDGSPVDADAPGAAIGLDLSGGEAVVAFSIGGNAAILADRAGFEQALPVPPVDAPIAVWQALFEGARLRGERNLGRPVTHAVVAAATSAAPLAPRLETAAAAAGLTLLRVIEPGGGHDAAALTAAMLAEDLAPRPEAP